MYTSALLHYVPFLVLCQRLFKHINAQCRDYLRHVYHYFVSSRILILLVETEWSDMCLSVLMWSPGVCLLDMGGVCQACPFLHNPSVVQTSAGRAWWMFQYSCWSASSYYYNSTQHNEYRNIFYVSVIL